MEVITSYISGIDPSVKTLPSAVYAIWWIALLVVIVVVVPLAIGLLHRTMRAAQSIKRYFAEMLAAGVGIAENTASVPELKNTIAVGTAMVETAGRLDEHSATIANLLATRAKEGTAS